MIRNKIYTIVLLLIGIVAVSEGQHIPLKRIFLAEDSNSEQGLKSNIINCIALQGEQRTWIGTGQGIAFMPDSTTIFTIDTMNLKNEEPRFVYDSISSIATKDSLIIFASLTRQDGDPVGTGIYLSENGLSNNLLWQRFDQPIDSVNDTIPQFGLGYFNARPLVGRRGVVSYSMAINDKYLWITSWYGGLRRLKLDGISDWERVPLPLDNQNSLSTCDINHYSEKDGKMFLQYQNEDYYWDSSDPNGNHNHKAFSMLAYGDTIWVGTANGINRGILGENGCIDWQHYFHPNDDLSGNWVLGIAQQEINNKRRIWAITVNAILESEERGLSFTDDDGITWQVVDQLSGKRFHDIAVAGATILLASDEGLWKSTDGENWELIPPAVEATPLSSNEILSNIVYSAAVDSREYYGKTIYWIGTADGLARAYDQNADNWQIYRAVADKDEVYAYPNPFSPFSHNQLNNDGWVRFNIGDTNMESVNLDIYNFALERVYSEKFDWQLNPGAVKWNGRDKNGELVANGVYFVKVKMSNNEEYWIKLIVVK